MAGVILLTSNMSHRPARLRTVNFHARRPAICSNYDTSVPLIQTPHIGSREQNFVAKFLGFACMRGIVRWTRKISPAK